MLRVVPSSRCTMRLYESVNVAARRTTQTSRTNTGMHILDAPTTAALLPYGQLTVALRAMLRTKAAEQVVAPQRMVLPLTHDGTLLVMPATSAELAVVKIVTVHPHNAPEHLARVQADVLVLDVHTGRRLYLLDGETVTARRTAALSLLAAQVLGAAAGGPLLLIGAGTQARAHLDAFVEGLQVKHVYIVARTASHAQQLADEAQQRWGITAQVLTDPDTVLARVPLIVTATTSTQPVMGSGVRPNAFIAAVGAYRPTMAEIPATVVQASDVYVDTLAGAQAEAGDLIQAQVDWAHVTPLAQAVDRPPRARKGPALFKSVGDAAWDLAAATVVHQSFKRTGNERAAGG